MERLQELKLIEQEVSSCSLCVKLKDRKNPVFGEGNINAKLMIIGEGPGRQEDLSGRPFVGDSGTLLTAMLRACEIKREDVFITNMVKCRCPNNRNPEKQEIDNCRKYLNTQISIIKPKILLLLGSVASVSIVGKLITDARGKWQDYNGIKTLCTYHPSFLLRQPGKKADAWKDLQLLIEALK